jgi:hypothetical protein
VLLALPPTHRQGVQRFLRAAHDCSQHSCLLRTHLCKLLLPLHRDIILTILLRGIRTIDIDIGSGEREDVSRYPK